MEIINMTRVTTVIAYLIADPIYCMEHAEDSSQKKEHPPTHIYLKATPKTLWLPDKYGGFEAGTYDRYTLNFDYDFVRRQKSYEDLPIQRTDDGAIVMQKDHIRYYRHANGKIVIINENGYQVNDSEKERLFLEQIDLLDHETTN